MDRPDDQENLQILRGLLFLRLALITPFFFVTVVYSSCAPAVTAALSILLLTMAGLPLLVYFLNRDWLARPAAPRLLVLFDFLLASLLSFVASYNEGTPVFFPLYLIVSLEAACWWGWPGALISGAAGGALLSWLYLNRPDLLPSNQGLGMISLVLAWPVILGYFAQWAIRQWRERRRMANWLARQEALVRQVKERLEGWSETCAVLQKTTSPQDLLKTALREAMANTGSTLGLIVMRDSHSGSLRVEFWEGFALSGPEKITLRPTEQLPALERSGLIEVQHVLEAPLRVASSSTSEADQLDLGRIIVARQHTLPYEEGTNQWLHIMAGYTATLLENRFLWGQLGRIQEEADSIALAGSTLASLPNPAAAMEIACRNILDVLDLEQIVIFLYGEATAQGCQIIVYPAQEPPRTTTITLQGRGLRLLRRFLDGGTSLIINRRGEYPQIFELMDWDEEVQAAACFPLYVLEHRWGALCLLAKAPNAFPSQTQQNLAIFSGKVAMTLENFYLRQSLTGANT